VRATHTVNQLLALARAEGGGTTMARQPCDLAELTVEAVQDCLPRAMDKSIDLGYEGEAARRQGRGARRQPTLLSEMLRNLLTTPSTTRHRARSIPAW
jgi:two-component system sensor histidine kinase TctE